MTLTKHDLPYNPTMLINCDMGEQLCPNPDPTAMPLIDLANVACGGHAGTPQSIADTLHLAHQYGVKVGAHPSYPDLNNFGRHSMTIDWLTLKKSLTQQVNRMTSTATHLGLNPSLHHIKPHGALYNDMMTNTLLFNNILYWMQDTYPTIPLMVLAGVNQTQRTQQANLAGVPLLFEAFADRAYLDNGQLAPRSQPNSLLTQPSDIVKQSLDFIARAESANIHSLCFHSDNPASITALQQLSQD